MPAHCLKHDMHARCFKLGGIILQERNMISFRQNAQFGLKPALVEMSKERQQVILRSGDALHFADVENTRCHMNTASKLLAERFGFALLIGQNRRIFLPYVIYQSYHISFVVSRLAERLYNDVSVVSRP